MVSSGLLSAVMGAKFLVTPCAVEPGKPTIQAAFGGALLLAGAAGSKEPREEPSDTSGTELGRPEKKPPALEKKTSGSHPKKATTFGGAGGPTLPPKSN